MSQNPTGRPALPLNQETPLENETPGVEAPPLQEALPSPSRANAGYRVTGRAGSHLQPMAHGPRSFFGGYGQQWGAGWVDALLIDQLLTDPKIYQGLTILKNAVLGRSIRSVPCVGPSHPDWETALELAEFCNENRRMKASDSWAIQLRQLLDGVLGHKIAAIETEVRTYGKYRGKWMLKHLDVWPSFGYEFMADEHGRFCAVRIQGERGQTRDIDPRKFLIFTFRPRDDNPYGTNILAPLCEPYYKSVQANPELIALLTQYGRPGLYVIAPRAEPGVPMTNIPVFDENTGEQARDANDLPLQLSPLQWNAISTKDYRAGTIVHLAGGSLMGMLQATPGGDSLFRFLKEDTDRDKIATLLGTDKLTESNGTLSEGNAGSSEAVMGYGILDIRRNVEEIDENLMATLIELNYGPRALDLLPISDIGSMTNPRMVGQMNAWIGYVNSGAADVDQDYWNCVSNGYPIPTKGAPKVIVPRAPTQAGGNQNNKDNGANN